MSAVTVYYLLIDHEKDHIEELDSVNVRNDATVIDLRDTIKERRSDVLAHVAATALIVWKCMDKATGTRSFRDLKKIVKSFNFSEESKDVEPVDPEDTIGELGLLHREKLLVQVPRVLYQGQDPTGQHEDNFDYYINREKAELFLSAPSAFNDYNKYCSLQHKDNERIYDNRPIIDEGIPPLPLLYHGFGRFNESLRSKPANERMPRLKNAVDKIADVVCELQGDDDDMECDTQQFLLEIVSMASPTLVDLFTYIPGAKTGSYVLGPHHGPLVIAEWKRELKVAEQQVAAYFRRLANVVDEKIFKGWRLPCLAILIRGPYISFQGLVLLDQHVRSLPLTDALLCVRREPGGEDRQSLYAAFNAAVDLIKCIREDAEKHMQNNDLRRIPGPERCFPNVTCLTKEGEAGALRFQIRKHLGVWPKPDMRYLYEAEITDPSPQTIVVKFTKTYGAELHRFCANLGFAPPLRAFQRLPGGWFGVAMDYISQPSISILDSPLLAELGEKWIEKIEAMVKAIHDAGFVHGDLRLPNFMFDDERVLLIDFDWGGEISKAKFPDVDLVPDLRTDRGEVIITKERDNDVLKHTVGAIRRIISQRGGNLSPQHKRETDRAVGREGKESKLAASEQEVAETNFGDLVSY